MPGKEVATCPLLPKKSGGPGRADGVLAVASSFITFVLISVKREKMWGVLTVWRTCNLMYT